MKYLIKNSYGVFFIGFSTGALGDTIFGDYGLTVSIMGFSLMLFSFYLMYLNSKQKKQLVYQFPMVKNFNLDINYSDLRF